MARTFLMVSALVALLVGCRGGDGAASAPAQTACARVVSLCQGNDQDRQACERAFVDMRPNVDAENTARTARCVGEARTCGEASGCMAGGAARASAGFIRDFTNGLTR